MPPRSDSHFAPTERDETPNSALFNERDLPLPPARPISSSPREWQPPFAQIVLDRNNIWGELTYAIPDVLRERAQPGMAVIVPFGNQQLSGTIVGLADECVGCEPSRLKAIAQVNGTVPVFDANALKLARWMSAYYHCSLGECLACMIPAGWQSTSERKYFVCANEPLRALKDLSRAPRQQQIAQLLLNAEKPLSQKEIVKLLQKRAAEGEEIKLSTVVNALRSLIEVQIVASEDQLQNPNVRARRVLAVKLSPASTCSDAEIEKLQRSAPKQFAALQTLRELGAAANAPEWFPVAALQKEWKIDAGALRGLEKKQCLEFGAVEQSRASFTRLPPSDVGKIALNSQQQNAVDGIAESLGEAQENQQSQVVLLHGVTASGKTEVYLHAIEKCLEMKRRALVLVPEIALTAQTVEIFQRRFQEKVAILHSALGAGERFDEWRRIRDGDAEIVVGARSAIFAPIENLGLIIVDEEHDGSYKQDATPRYHARDVACKRASYENAVVVLGSATPCLESFQRAMKNEYKYLQMPERFASRPLPTVEIVDMTKEASNGALPLLSRRLQDELVGVVGKGEQAIIFLNRRGFATYVQCLGCGHVEECPNCDVSLTFHRGAQLLKCHHCDYEKPVLHECPQCNGWMIGFTGSGTEKVQSEIEALLSKRGFKDAQVLRLDRDTTSGKGAHAQILGEFRKGRAQVLIGTQMVTKGLDFPNVTLVGVISADTALNVPDFRASERTFQLLSQVAGRAGRGSSPGRVLIQTLAADHAAIVAAQKHDYETFVRQELELRRELPYPPWSYVVNIVSSDEDEREARARLAKLAARFQAAIMKAGNHTELLGPVSCPLARVKNKFRFHLMLRDRNRPRLHQILAIYDALPRDEKLGLIVDVDCMSIL